MSCAQLHANGVAAAAPLSVAMIGVGNHPVPSLLSVLNSRVKRCFGHLLVHPLFAWSWIVFVVAAVACALVAMESRQPTAASTVGQSTVTILVSSLFVGYACWSMYWGLPPWGRLVVQGYQKTPKALVGIVGCSTGVVLLLPIVVIAGIYSLLGGGIFHFSRRWWLLCNPKVAAVESHQGTSTAPAASSQRMQDLENLESQLRKLDELYWGGLITRDEYESRRRQVLKNAL